MAITVVGTTTQTHNQQSVFVTFPAGYANPTVDDVVVIAFSSTATAPTTTIPSGWVNCHPSGGSTRAEADTCWQAMAYHLVTSAEDSANTKTYTLTSCLSALTNWAAVGIVLRGVDATTPIDSTNATFDSANSATPNILPSLLGSNLSTGSMVVGATSNDATKTYTDPGGWTRQGYADNSGTTSTVMFTRDTTTTAGTDVTATNVTPSAGDEYCSFTTAFLAAGGGPPPNTTNFFLMF